MRLSDERNAGRLHKLHAHLDGFAVPGARGTSPNVTLRSLAIPSTDPQGESPLRDASEHTITER